MQRCKIALWQFFTLALLFPGTSPSTAQTRTIILTSGFTEVVHLARASRSVKIGDPRIAEITTSGNMVFITGKENGTTEFSAVGDDGVEIYRATLAVAAGATGAINLMNGHAVNLRIGRPAQSIVVGNPKVADVTLSGIETALIVTAKAPGSTNIIAFDDKGIEILNKNINVSFPVTVVGAGVRTSTYLCNPNCSLSKDKDKESSENQDH